MCDVDVSRLIADVDPFDLSASIAERGKNAGKETWSNALGEATERPLDIDDRDSVKAYFAGFGAWDDEEIASWSDTDLDALVLQFAAGDLRELQSLAPGDGLADIDWTQAEELAQAGTCGGRLYAHDNKLFICVTD